MIKMLLQGDLKITSTGIPADSISTGMLVGIAALLCLLLSLALLFIVVP